MDEGEGEVWGVVVKVRFVDVWTKVMFGCV